MREFLMTFETLISGIFPFVALLLTGLYLTVKTRGFQFRKFFASVKFSLFSEKKGDGGISSFGAVCNSLAATVGTGNIAGVAAAISVGGAGAVFWMWVSAVVSMCVKAAEIVIAIFYRKNDKNGYFGGPMYYIRDGLGKKFTPLAVVFSVSGIFSAFGTGNITQVNSCTSVISRNFYVKLIIGVVLCVVVGIVIIGGVEKITEVTTRVLPLMAVLYIVFCLTVIFKNIRLLDDALLSIFKGAFSPQSVTGGAVGSVYSTVITGAQKGIFSNEAGLGTVAIAHSSAKDASVQTQGLFGVFEVFVDTLLICTLTALTILCSGVIIDYSKVASSGLVSEALSTVYGDFSAVMLSVMLLLFGVASVIGWAAYGMSFSNFLLGKKGEKIFILIYPLFCIAGAVVNVQFAWRVAEFFNGIMLITNIFAVLMLSQKAVSVLGE